MLFKNLEKQDHNQYNKLLTKSDSAMIYHSIPYLKMVCELLNVDYKIWGLFDNDELVSACPWIIKEGKFGKIYNSLAYYGANGGIVSKDNASFELLKKEILNSLKGDCASFTYISSTLGNNRLELDQKDIHVQERRAQITPFPPKSESIAEDVMQMCHSKNRNTIRKAFKENITFHTTQDWSFLFSTHQANMEAIGVKAKSERFFNSIPSFFEYGKDFKIYEAQIDGVKVCAVLVFYQKDVVYYYTPAVLQEYRNRQPLSALIYHIMCKEIENEYKFWDWGGTPLSNEALYKFKNRWGTEDRKYFIETMINNSDILNATPSELSEEYPSIFVAPYELLQNH